MKITLKQLNDGFGALSKLAQTVFPKEQAKLSYRFSRIYRSAKAEIEEMQFHLQKLMVDSGFYPGERDVDPQKLYEYGRDSRAFLASTEIEIWGDPMPFSMIKPYVEISPADQADLHWLFTVDDEGRGDG